MMQIPTAEADGDREKQIGLSTAVRFQAIGAE
jgi:hypothetical protein